MEVGRRAFDLSLRAIDAYRKTFLVDKVTSDDETPAPESILDEISNILTSCSLELTKEIVEYAFRRLRHRSPQVKTKVLRFLKYTVNKAGSSVYRRELQMHSISIRELLNFQGEHSNPKDNASSQAVQNAAQEALRAIFYTDLVLTSKSIQIEGFGSGNFSNLLAASWNVSGGGSSCSGNSCESSGYSNDGGSNGNGSFESMKNEQKSLETEAYHQLDVSDTFESPNCNQEIKEMASLGELSRQEPRRKLCVQSLKVIAPEERLLNDVTAPIGPRLRPSEASLQSFLSVAKAHDANKIAGALKGKLRSSSWKVRLRAVSVLRAILRQEDGSLLKAIKADDGDFHEFVCECSNFPQTNLKREAQEALVMLSALKEVKMHGKTVNDPIGDRCNEPLLTNSLSVGKTGSSSSIPAVVSQNELVDLLSFEVGELTCGPGLSALQNSVAEDPFDEMRVRHPNDEASIHMKDLLSDTWVSTYSQTPFGTPQSVENKTQSPVIVQSSKGQQSKQEINLQGLDFLTDIAGDMSYSRNYFPYFLESNKTQTLSKIHMPGIHNLDKMFMHPEGAVGSLHTNTRI